jgi:hypothetical protein
MRGPEPGDAVIVTNEFVLAKIIEGGISARRALEIGIIAVDGERHSAAWVEDKIALGVVPRKSPPEKMITGTIVTPWGGASAAFSRSRSR